MINIGTLSRHLNKTGLTLSEAAFCVRVILDCMTEGLERGEEIRLKGFGTFSVKARGKTLLCGGGKNIPKHNRIIFMASRMLKNTVNGKQKRKQNSGKGT